MFGYINVNRKELSQQNFRTYQSYYCGLCRELKQHYGKKGQVCLNYDMTFLIVLLTGLYENDTICSEFRCGLHPTKMHTALKNEVTAYAADMNVLLAYHNLMDDWEDERNGAKLMMAKALAKDYDRLRKKYPRQAEAVELAMKELKACEKNKERNVDVVAGTTGNMLGAIFAWKEDHWQEELYTLGFYLGKFIYLMDAYEDRKRDEKAGRYNPLIDAERENRGDYETLCRLMLTSMMSECAKCFERLPILLHGEILRNVIYSGVWTKYEYLQCKNKKSEEKKSKKEKEER